MSKAKLILPVATAMLLASCAGGATGLSVSSKLTLTSHEQKAGIIKEDTNIVFWSTFNDNYQSTIQEAANKFMELEPKVHVEIKKESGSYTALKDKVIENLAAQSHPDMFVGYPDSVQELMQYGAVVRLDPYMNNEEYGWAEDELEDVIKAYRDEGESYPIEGVYSVPVAKSTEAMFYNKDVLVGLNLSAQDATINEGKPLTEEYINNLTWEELFDKLCPAIVAYNDSLAADKKILLTGDKKTAVFAYDSDDNLFITLAEQYGYGYTSLDTSTGTGSIDFVNDGMKGLLKKFYGYAHKEGTPYFLTKGSNENKYTNENFTAGYTLFSVGSTGGANYQKSDNFDTGVAKIPHAAGKAAKVINQGPSIAVLDHKDENRKLASWLFYKFFTNTDNAAVWAINSGYNPIRYSTLDSADYAEYASLEGKQPRTVDIIKARVSQYVTPVSDDLFASPVFKGSAEARTQAGALFTNALMLENLTDDALNKLFDDAKNNVLAKM